MSNIIDDSFLPAWEPCNQCRCIGVDEKQDTIYTGSNDNRYLHCAKCKEWTHPTCDKIDENDADLISKFYCKKCRSRTRKIVFEKITISQVEVPIAKTPNQLIANNGTSPTIEIHSTDNEPAQKQRETKEKSQSKKAASKSHKELKSNEKQLNSEQKNDHMPENSIENKNPEPDIQIVNQNLSQNNEKADPHPSSADEGEENSKACTEPDTTSTKNPHEEDETLSQYLRAIPAAQVNNENTEIQQVNSQQCDLENSIHELEELLNEKMPLLPVQVQTELKNIENTAKAGRKYKVNSKADMKERAQKHPLQHRSKQEVILDYVYLEASAQSKDLECKQKDDQIATLNKIKENYDILMKALEIKANATETDPESKIAALQIKVAQMESTTKENAKKIEDLKKLNNSKQAEIKKLKEVLSSNQTKINELEGIREQTQGRIVRTEELLTLKTQQVESLNEINQTSENETAKLNEELERRNNQINNIQKENSALKHEIEAIMNSLTEKEKNKDDEIEICPQTPSENAAQQRKELCVYFKMGGCKARNCKFQHSQINNEKPKTPQEPNINVNIEEIPMPGDDDEDEDVCVFHKMGRCRDTKCTFRHISTKPTKEKEKQHVKKTCIYYIKGTCKYDESCHFAHDKSPRRQAKKDTPCRYFESGYCIWEDKCEFLHLNKELPVKKVRTSINHQKSTCQLFLKGNCKKGNFCTNIHPDPSTRCKDFDEGYCSRKSMCPRPHMPDRPERKIHKKVNHEPRYRDAVTKSREAATNEKQVPIQYEPRYRDAVTKSREAATNEKQAPIQINQTLTVEDQELTSNIRRCIDFDQGYCPNYRSCRLQHAKDRNHERNTKSTSTSRRNL